jgi:hypothetical protein
VLHRVQLHEGGYVKIALAIVVAVGLAIGLLWTRDTSKPSPRSTPVHGSSKTKLHPADSTPADSTRLPAPTLPTRKRLELTDDPVRRPLQEELHKQLRAFAVEAKLTDEQVDLFERDLSELAAIEAGALMNGVRARTFDGVLELNAELG